MRKPRRKMRLSKSMKRTSKKNTRRKSTKRRRKSTKHSMKRIIRYKGGQPTSITDIRSGALADSKALTAGQWAGPEIQRQYVEAELTGDPGTIFRRMWTQHWGIQKELEMWLGTEHDAAEPDMVDKGVWARIVLDNVCSTFYMQQNMNPSKVEILDAAKRITL